MRDLYSNLAVDQLHDPAVTSSDANSSGVDMQGYDSLLLVANIGESADTLNDTNMIEVEVEHADDDGSGSPATWEDVTDSDLLNTVTGTNNGTFAHIDAADEDDAVYITGYVGGRRHVRVVLNFSGTHSTGTPISVTAVRGHAAQLPVN